MFSFVNNKIQTGFSDCQNLIIFVKMTLVFESSKNIKYYNIYLYVINHTILKNS